MHLPGDVMLILSFSTITTYRFVTKAVFIEGLAILTVCWTVVIAMTLDIVVKVYELRIMLTFIPLISPSTPQVVQKREPPPIWLSGLIVAVITCGQAKFNK